LANVFGRRWPMIVSTATFVLGSGICGGAMNMTTLIAGRVVQGIGAGGINVLTQIIVSDLVPLAERGGYFAITFGCVAIGTALGPFIGGVIVQHSTWRWVFYLNLPIGGLALVLLFVFLHVNYIKERTFADRLGKIDWAGNAIFIASITSIVRLPLLRTTHHHLTDHYSYNSWLDLLGRAPCTVGQAMRYSCLSS
jgi:MFS family permease